MLTVLHYCIAISLIFAIVLLFLNLFLLLDVCFICVNKYLFTYFRAVGLYSHFVYRTSSQCIGSGVVSPLVPKLLV